MHVGIYGKGLTESSVKNIRKILESKYIKSSYLSSSLLPKQLAKKQIDCIVVLGGDRGIRNYFHKFIDQEIPVLGINEAESSSFLAQLDLKDLSSNIDRLKQQDYTIKQVSRVDVKIDGKKMHPILNDVAVFPAESAILMEHTLKIQDEEVWHDISDGIIISTPLGSSAYSMSAGGPMIFEESTVFEIISVNSLDITRRPLIVSDQSMIKISDISSKLHCVVVLDGDHRCKVKKTVECSRFFPNAKIIHMKKELNAISTLAKKVHLAEELLSMSPSSKLLLKTLEYEGALTHRELINKTLLPDRTIRLALSHLLQKGYIKRKVSIRDARQKIYEIAKIN